MFNYKKLLSDKKSSGFNKQLGKLSILVLASCFSFSAFSDQNHSDQSHDSHLNHSDDLLVLLKHKIALQKLQQQQQANPKLLKLDQQAKHFESAMPILKKYSSTPKSYYLTSEMYHESLENRAAMLADFSQLLVHYQQQLEKSRQLN